MSLSLVVDLRLGLLIPPVYAIYEKKARTFVRALLVHRKPPARLGIPESFQL